MGVLYSAYSVSFNECVRLERSLPAGDQRVALPSRCDVPLHLQDENWMYTNVNGREPFMTVHAWRLRDKKERSPSSFLSCWNECIYIYICSVNVGLMLEIGNWWHMSHDDSLVMNDGTFGFKISDLQDQISRRKVQRPRLLLAILCGSQRLSCLYGNSSYATKKLCGSEHRIGFLWVLWTHLQSPSRRFWLFSLICRPEPHFSWDMHHQALKVLVSNHFASAEAEHPSRLQFLGFSFSMNYFSAFAAPMATMAGTVGFGILQHTLKPYLQSLEWPATGTSTILWTDFLRWIFCRSSKVVELLQS